MSTELSPDVAGALDAALDGHAHRFASPEARGHLRALWARDFAGLAPGIVPDMVALRMNKPEYSHFMIPPPSPQEAAAARAQASIADQIKLSYDRLTGRDQGAIGLGGLGRVPRSA